MKKKQKLEDRLPQQHIAPVKLFYTTENIKFTNTFDNHLIMVKNKALEELNHKKALNKEKALKAISMKSLSSNMKNTMRVLQIKDFLAETLKKKQTVSQNLDVGPTHPHKCCLLQAQSKPPSHYPPHQQMGLETPPSHWKGAPRGSGL